ncbi:Spy/CpxP family protein refolding chaperone [uncultured Desulfosarcina sp.]|uniref:Spy/CpxP family protein refolding chaperone n=1 Tax=uncultured Desulfosarcina sp. TaxID=218289 RepID=UPI0029C94CB6|nr:Spy/CpxP family protein refolding chaperone [uncultured Desulfosarcina sp.]
MPKKTVLITVALASLFLVFGLAACKRGFHPGGFDEFDLAAVTNRIAAKLDLTEVQKADLEQIAGEIADKAKAMHADRESRLQDLADVVRQEVIDRDIVDQKIDEKILQFKEMADFVAERLIAFHATLTPEQREKIAERIEERASGGCRFGWR